MNGEETPDLPPGWAPETRAGALDALRRGSTPRAREALRRIPTAEGPPLVVGLCHTFTIEPHLDIFRLALATLGVAVDLEVAPLNSLEAEVLDPYSTLRRRRPDAIVVLWRLEDLAPQLVTAAWASNPEERRAQAQALRERIETLCRNHEQGAGPPLYLATLPTPALPTRRPAAAPESHGPEATRHLLNAMLLDLAATSTRIRIFDLEGWTARRGATAFDLRTEFLGRQPLAASAVGSLAMELARTLAPLTRPPAKVLAVDLDNTLWAGVLAEDGLSGLAIGHEFPGNVYRRIQQEIRTLAARGVVLVLLTRNDERDVTRAFATLAEMPLRLEDFAVVKANWEPKSVNLLRAAEELGLASDSFVFLDDQGYEREAMADQVPAVHVLPVTSDPLVMLEHLAACSLFDGVAVGAEDRTRTRDYASQRLRAMAHREAGGGATDFLHRLELRARITALSEGTLARAVQMLARTNQVNVTTRRHREPHVRTMMAPPGICLTLALSDRFGEQGVVGLALAIPENDSDHGLLLDSFLVSCRALNRGVEETLFAETVRRGAEAGYRTLRAHYIPTARNGQCATLFDRLGMERLDDVGDESAAVGYRLALPCHAEAPPWMTIETG